MGCLAMAPKPSSAGAGGWPRWHLPSWLSVVPTVEGERAQWRLWRQQDPWQVLGWHKTPRASPLGGEPVAQVESKVSAKGTEQVLPTPFHLWGHVPCPQARMAIGQTEPLALTVTRSGQGVQAGGKLTGMSVFQLRRSAEAGDKGQTDHLSPSASSFSSMSGHHWQRGTQGDTGENPQQEEPWLPQGH